MLAVAWIDPFSPQTHGRPNRGGRSYWFIVAECATLLGCLATQLPPTDCRRSLRSGLRHSSLPALKERLPASTVLLGSIHRDLPTGYLGPEETPAPFLEGEAARSMSWSGEAQARRSTVVALPSRPRYSPAPGPSAAPRCRAPSRCSG